MLHLTHEGASLIVRAPFHPAFPARARLLGGRWNGKVWSFPGTREGDVRELCLATYGCDGTASAKSLCVRVEVTVPCAGGPFEQSGTGVYLGGREIARSHRVGRRARPGKGVTFLRKAPVRAGSDEYPVTIIPHGAIFQVDDLPPIAAEALCRDIVAVRDGEPPILVVTELKLGFSLELVLQAVDRLRVADEIWLAVLATRRGRDRDRRAHRLCRQLGFGLLAVSVERAAVEVLAEPAPYRPRPDLKRRSRILQEHAKRRGDPARGGSTRQPIMTAYRQQALACAAALQSGPLRPRDLKSAAPDAGKILLRNVYGWFERVEPGLYRLAENGAAALAAWARDDDARPMAAPRPIDAERTQAARVL